MAGIQNRFSMSYKDCRFFLHPTGFSPNPLEIRDIRQADWNNRTETEPVNGVGAAPLYIASGMESLSGTLTIYGLAYQTLMAGLRVNRGGASIPLAGNSMTLNSYRHPDCTFEIRKRLPTNEQINYSVFERPNRHFLTGVVFNDGSHPSSAEGTGIIVSTLQFMFVCYNYTYDSSVVFETPIILSEPTQTFDVGNISPRS